MKLEDCKEGDFVILWCIGINRWDDEVVKVKTKPFVTVEIEYKNGHVATFFTSCECKKATW